MKAVKLTQFQSYDDYVSLRDLFAHLRKCLYFFQSLVTSSSLIYAEPTEFIRAKVRIYFENIVTLEVKSNQLENSSFYRDWTPCRALISNIQMICSLRARSALWSRDHSHCPAAT